MCKLSVLFILFVAFYSKDALCESDSQKAQSDDGKIVGGTATTIEKYPHMAYLLLFNGTVDFQCGGSIVNRRNIVTAAHCLTDIIRVRIRIGSTNANSGGMMYEATSWFTHPMYDDSTSDYDIAVIRVATGMTLNGNTTKAIALVDRGNDVTNGDNVTATGWGAIREGGPTTSTLMEVTIPAVNRTRCRELIGNGITTRMFCAGLEEGGKDSCQGDSGGPAVVNNKLAGVTSFGYGCARPNSPGVYTRIGHFMIRPYIRMLTGE